MSDKQNSTLNEEREPLSKGWIFAGIVLFPLIPFVLIYFNKHLKKKMKMILGICLFCFLVWCLSVCMCRTGTSIK